MKGKPDLSLPKQESGRGQEDLKAKLEAMTDAYIQAKNEMLSFETFILERSDWRAIDVWDEWKKSK